MDGQARHRHEVPARQFSERHLVRLSEERGRIWIERTGTNEEQTTVLSIAGNVITARVTMAHPDQYYVTRQTHARHVTISV